MGIEKHTTPYICQLNLPRENIKMVSMNIYQLIVSYWLLNYYQYIMQIHSVTLLLKC